MEIKNTWCYVNVDKVDNTSLGCEFKHGFVYCFFI